MKHSKFKNGGLLFELLTRQITVDALNNSQSKATKILQKNFHKKSELFKENQLFNVILESRFASKDKATYLVESTIKAYRKSINVKVLSKEKYALIKDLKETFNLEDFFKSRVSSYRLLASVHNVLTEDFSNPKTASKSFYTLVEHVSREKVTEEQGFVEELKKENKDLRGLAYRILVERFNKKYKVLTTDQKEVLREYINNISNTNGLKEFIESKYKIILHDLKKMLPGIDNKVVKIKIRECFNLLETAKVTNKNSKDALRLMRFYQLLEDIKSVKWA